MNTVEVHSTSEIHAMLRAARKEGRGMAAMIGFGIGIFAAGAVSVGVGYSLDIWRVANHERLVAEADRKVSECIALWNETQPESYSNAIAARRQIVALMRGGER